MLPNFTTMQPQNNVFDYSIEEGGGGNHVCFCFAVVVFCCFFCFFFFGGGGGGGREGALYCTEKCFILRI